MDTGIEKSNIQGVEIHPLKEFYDERGAVLHMVRVDSPYFRKFGEVYFSEVSPQKIKGWKRHKRMTQNFAIPKGKIRLVLYDSRASSPSHGVVDVHLIGRPDNYSLISIPPMIWYGFQGISEDTALVVNCADFPHDPDESEGIEPTSIAIPFSWA